MAVEVKKHPFLLSILPQTCAQLLDAFYRGINGVAISIELEKHKGP
jgi:hypothetical protein